MGELEGVIDQPSSYTGLCSTILTQSSRLIIIYNIDDSVVEAEPTALDKHDEDSYVDRPHSASHRGVYFVPHLQSLEHCLQKVATPMQMP